MFTGIVLGTCPVTAVAHGAGTTALTVDLGEYAEGLELGASVAVNGTCLTAVHVADGQVRFDIIEETWQQTNLSDLRVGALCQRRAVVSVGRRSRWPHPVGSRCDRHNRHGRRR